MQFPGIVYHFLQFSASLNQWDAISPGISNTYSLNKREKSRQQEKMLQLKWTYFRMILTPMASIVDSAKTFFEERMSSNSSIWSKRLTNSGRFFLNASSCHFSISASDYSPLTLNMTICWNTIMTQWYWRLYKIVQQWVNESENGQRKKLIVGK